MAENGDDLVKSEQLEPGDMLLRHRLSTRIWHWINALVMLMLLMSGLMILNAHPRLYWGHYGANADQAWLEFSGGPAFPGWMTLPSQYSLSLARNWHFFCAWLFVIILLLYLLISLANGHIRRDLLPRRAELAPSHIWDDIKLHARLNFRQGAYYNILQKLSYISVIFVLLPLMILTGLTMSPAIDAGWPWLLDLFGGRQSARSLHFVCAMSLVAFVLLHIVMVLAAGPVNEIRSMISGRYHIPVKRDP